MHFLWRQSILTSLSLAFLAVVHGRALADDTADASRAFADVNWAWSDRGPCSDVLLCATYLGDFSIKLHLDGTITPVLHVQRLTTSAHDCIQRALEALAHGDKALAVSWVVATQLHNQDEMDWLGTHSNLVVSTLDHFDH